jgi:hypothetical protein
MLSETTRGYLATLTYRADAKRQVCWLPLGGICWDDEMPDIRRLMKIPEEDRTKIFRLFGIRARLWKGEALPYEDQQFWDTEKASLPGWAFFQRQKISADDQRAQQAADQTTTEFLQALAHDADEAKVTEKDGIQSFSFTFDLAKVRPALPTKRSWWKRIFGQKQPDR